MPVEQVVGQEVPFVIEPIAPARLKLWARFAARVSSDTDIALLKEVYRGFWWEVQAVSSNLHMLSRLEFNATYGFTQESVSALVGWLDHLAWQLEMVASSWSAVTQMSADGAFVPPRYYNDADNRIASALELLGQVRAYGVFWCQSYGLPIPNLLALTNASPTVSAVGEGVERV